MKKLLNKEGGFTLLELSVSMAIIGLLIGVGAPRYEVYKQKARQMEAKTGISAMATLQKAYIFEYGRAADSPADLGVSGAKGDFSDNYAYEVDALDATGAADATGKEFRIIATSDKADAYICDGGTQSKDDKWCGTSKKIEPRQSRDVATTADGTDATKWCRTADVEVGVGSCS